MRGFIPAGHDSIEPMIYDTFLFYNELELLDLRLNELWDVVDRFVLVESTRTHSNKPKALYYAGNRERFARFESKIIHVVLDREDPAFSEWTPTGRSRFAIEDRDRRGVSRGLVGCLPDDVILTGDVDEIPRADSLRRAVEQLRSRDSGLVRLWGRFAKQPWMVNHGRSLLRKWHPCVLALEQRMYYYFFNFLCASQPSWIGSKLMMHRHFTSAYDLRRWGGRPVREAGWHFSYMGGVERIRSKIAAYAHTEYDKPEFTDPEEIARRLRQGQDVLGTGVRLEWVPIDDSFPVHLRENPEKYAEFIGPPR